jgi:nucleoside-diphosphate-sugar epimerase
MKANYPSTTLMTGSTGFLGNFVLRDLLNRGRRVVAVLRAPLAERRERLLKVLEEIGLDVRGCVISGHLVLVEGSLPDNLPAPTWGRTDGILHNAASLELFTNGDPQGDPYRTNVEGAKAVTAWADRHGVSDILAVSTAYTCGWNSGVIPETFHEPQPRFQTDYEKSKWLAEILFHQWSQQPGRTLTIFRPSFLVGDSQTGYTTQFAGFYQFARLVGVLKQQYHDPGNGRSTYIPLRIPGKGDDVQNVAPVDFVSRMIAEIAVRPEYHGRIYHLTNPQPPTNDLFKRCYEEYFGLHGGFFAPADEVVGRCTPAESLLWDQYHLLTPRVVHTPRFDTSNTQRVMQKLGIAFPVLDRDRILMLLDWAAARNWGRNTGGRKLDPARLVHSRRSRSEEIEKNKP